MEASANPFTSIHAHTAGSFSMYCLCVVLRTPRLHALSPSQRPIDALPFPSLSLLVAFYSPRDQRPFGAIRCRPEDDTVSTGTSAHTHMLVALKEGFRGKNPILYDMDTYALPKLRSFTTWIHTLNLITLKTIRSAHIRPFVPTYLLVPRSPDIGPAGRLKPNYKHRKTM